MKVYIILGTDGCSSHYTGYIFKNKFQAKKYLKDNYTNGWGGRYYIQEEEVIE